MNPIKSLAKALDDGWFSRIMLVGIIWFAWRMSDWAMAYAGTVLAMEGKSDLQGAALVIGAVGVLPVGILTWGLNAYSQMRTTQPRVIEDRRIA